MTARLDSYEHAFNDAIAVEQSQELDRHYAQSEAFHMKAELAAAYERIKMLEAELLECREYFDQRADADCDQDGFIPNEEMRRVASIDECLHGPGNF